MTRTPACSVLQIPFGLVRQRPELLEEYIAECDNGVLGRPDPQWEMYALLAASGVFFALGAFDGAELVGFATVLTTPHLHSGRKVATLESIFVAKAYRRRGAGTMLRQSVKAFAKAKGCSHVITTAPAGSQLEAILWKRGTRTGSSYCEAV